LSYTHDIETNQDKSILKFFVEDTGIGIAKNKQDFIFDAFRQVDDSNTSIYGGTGIGLSLVKKLTEFLGGKAWLESEDGRPFNKNGKGSTFYFTIPINKIKNYE
jgi:signal transduction histidine kinase